MLAVKDQARAVHSALLDLGSTPMCTCVLRLHALGSLMRIVKLPQVATALAMEVGEAVDSQALAVEVVETVRQLP